MLKLIENVGNVKKVFLYVKLTIEYVKKIKFKYSNYFCTNCVLDQLILNTLFVISLYEIIPKYKTFNLICIIKSLDG